MHASVLLPQAEPCSTKLQSMPPAASLDVRIKSEPSQTRGVWSPNAPFPCIVLVGPSPTRCVVSLFSDIRFFSRLSDQMGRPVRPTPVQKYVIGHILRYADGGSRMIYAYTPR